MKMIVVFAGLLLAMPMAASAQGMGAGAAEFQDHCAVCHGAGGKGDGTVGVLFAHKPKDLTQLSKENGGEFPFEKVVASIDGRQKFPAHGIGDSPMPIWGTYLMMQGIQEQGLTPDIAQEVVQGRIYALTYYIQSIQE